MCLSLYVPTTALKPRSGILIYRTNSISFAVCPSNKSVGHEYSIFYYVTEIFESTSNRAKMICVSTWFLQGMGIRIGAERGQSRKCTPNMGIWNGLQEIITWLFIRKEDLIPSPFLQSSELSTEQCRRSPPHRIIIIAIIIIRPSNNKTLTFGQDPNKSEAKPGKQTRKGYPVISWCWRIS